MAELTLRNIRNKLWLNMRLLLVITAIAILFSPAVAIICIIIQQLRKILMLLETHDTIEARMESAIEKERRKRQKVSRPVYKKQIRFKSLSILTKNGTSTEQKPNNPNPCGILRKKAEEQPSHNFSEAPAKTTEIIKTSARKTSVSISSANIESRIEMERGKRNKESLPAYKKQESLKSSSTLTKKSTSTEQKPNDANSSGILRKKAEDQPNHNSCGALTKKTEIIKTYARKSSVSIPSARIESSSSNEMEKKQNNSNSCKILVKKAEENRPNDNSCEAPTKTEIINTSVKKSCSVGIPSVNIVPLTVDVNSQIRYIDESFESENSSDESDFVFLDY
ncbi:micronuclear linker histone polyprotein-like [Argiope bruennichi]|uniref:micronuclear linker histone polyprotein-like n=1 Tax=Argiope bruennichi TaxID=94029 RepID=UPI002493D5E3|nr:micronuclear linker histone polyprotein-like [Argiope bruennichi]